MILYRPVGLQELEMIYDNGMKAFPARLPQQPIFYPVLQLEYARQTASDWNARNGQLAGYVTQFKVEAEYIRQFEEHTVGESQYQELWIPAEEIEEFNRYIMGHIKVVEAHFGDGFQGFVPEKFGLQGKNAAEQFTVLASTYMYKRLDFYLEIKRNHKAVFLNYPFWLTHDFKNSGLKGKVLQAIKEAWLTSFPQIPLPLPPPLPEDTPPETPTHTHEQDVFDVDEEDITPVEETDSSLLDPVEDTTPARESEPHSWVTPLDGDNMPFEQSNSHAEDLADPLQEEEDTAPVEQNDPDSELGSAHEDAPLITPAHGYSVVDPVDEEVTPRKPTRSHFVGSSVREGTTPHEKTNPHYVQGIQLGLSEMYPEAIEELSRVIKEDPDDVVAYTSLGVAFYRVGQNDRALACYETALKTDPIYAEAHYFRANVLYDQGNVREAIAGYTIAVGLKPALIDAHRKTVPQDRLTDYSSSPAEIRRIAKPAHRILDLNKLIESHPRQANLFKERAAEYYRLRNYAQAIADYSSALAMQPDDASALHLRGVAYEQLGQVNHALEDYQQAIAVDPELSNFYINQGVTFGKMGNYRQSVASLTESIRLTPGNPDVYFNRGIAYLQLREFESAIEDFSSVIQLSPRDEEAYYWRGISHEETGRRREAIADYRQFLTISQNAQARAEIEQKLSRWNEGKRNGVSNRGVIPDDRQKTNPSQPKKYAPDLDLHALIVALGERSVNSTWFGTGVNCYGEKAEELYAFTEHNRPISGRGFRSIASGIHQTVSGDFQAFDPGADSPWIFIRAWEGSGFYIETNDLRIKKQLKAHFPLTEEVEGASPPYESLFIHS
ncbi:MAG TPA: tetratricopeptide repeat protein [Anaerolineales bacterium]|nr:tetratricopeptide repeat protein [Anaerolineales bacterium]